MQRRVLPVSAVVVALCASLGFATAMAQTPAPGPAPAPKPAAAPVSSSAAVAKDSRVFELRTYYAEPGKLDALHARFRDHTTRLFQKHGMTIIAYWMPREAPDRIVYVLAYKSKEAADAALEGLPRRPRLGQGPHGLRSERPSGDEGRIDLHGRDRLLADQVASRRCQPEPTGRVIPPHRPPTSVPSSLPGRSPCTNRNPLSLERLTGCIHRSIGKTR